MNKKYLLQIQKLLGIVLSFLIINKITYAQCYIVASDEHKRIMWEQYGVIVEERQGNFASYDECIAYLNSSIDFDPVQRARHWCDCEKEDQKEFNNSYEQNNSNLIVEDREAQLQKIRLYEQEKLKEKELADRKIVEDKKQDLLGKLKKNNALDQLKTSSELSQQGTVNINNSQTEKGRDDSELAFSDGKIKLKGRPQKNNIQVSQPKPIEDQKVLFDYIDRETKVVQNKIMQVQKEKIKLLEKKNDIQKTLSERTLKIEKLKTEKINSEVKTQIEEIDSLLMIANQLLQESEDLNIKVDQELEEKNKLEQDSEALLNSYQNVYNKSKENPDQSEQLLKELKGEK